jgi:tetratricopeptide (TPR) repeat protein
LAEEAEPRLYQADQIQWLDQLEKKYDNLRAALNWTLVEHLENVETGLRLAAALAYYWEMRGILLEGHRWLSAALEQADSASAPLQASVYLNAGNFWLEHALLKGPNETCVRKSLALYRRLGDDRGIAWTLRLQGNCAVYFEQDYDRATSLLEQSLALAKELNDRPLLIRIYQNLGRTKMFSGDHTGAVELGEKGLTLAREMGDRWAIGYLSYHLGITAARQGDYARAEVHLLEALAVCRELKLEVNATKTLNPLGEMARLQGKYDQAASYYQEYVALALRIPGWDYYSMPLANLGWVAIEQGDLPRAVDFFRQSIASDLAGDTIAWNLWGLEVVAAMQGRTRQAARLYAVVDNLLESGISSPIVYREDQDAYRDHKAFVRRGLGEYDFAAAWAEGQRMSVEEAIAYALEAEV